jgi:hypothetical protein
MKDNHGLTTSKEPNDIQLWHERFGHLGVKNLKLLSNKNVMEGMNIDEKIEFTFYDKHTREVTSRSISKRWGIICKQVVGDSPHFNVWGPTKMPSFEGVRYFVSFIDDFSRKSLVYILKSKGKCFSKFKDFQAVRISCTLPPLKYAFTKNPVTSGTTM